MKRAEKIKLINDINPEWKELVSENGFCEKPTPWTDQVKRVIDEIMGKRRGGGVLSNTLPSRAKDSVWPVTSAFSRQRDDICQCRRPSSPHPGQTEWCAPPNGGREKDGVFVLSNTLSSRAGDSVWPVTSVAARLFPSFSRVRCTIPQANAVSERNLPPARAQSCVERNLLLARARGNDLPHL